MNEKLHRLHQLPNSIELTSSQMYSDDEDGVRRIEYYRHSLNDLVWHQVSLDVYHNGKWEEIFGLILAESPTREIDIEIRGVAAEKNEELEGIVALERFNLDDPQNTLIEQNLRLETKTRFRDAFEVNGLAEQLYDRSALPKEVDLELTAMLFLNQLESNINGINDFDNPILVPPKDSLLPEDQILIDTESSLPVNYLNESDPFGFVPTERYVSGQQRTSF